MPKKHIQPPELFSGESLGFTQVVTSPPGELVFISGQVAADAELNPVGGTDLAAQAKQALKNLGHALAAANATPADVTLVRMYVVNYKPEYIETLGAALTGFFAGAKPPASTWVGVQALAMPELMIEIEAIAVVNG